jgi:hypothetical protein
VPELRSPARATGLVKMLTERGLTPDEAEDIVIRNKIVRDSSGNHYIAWNGVMPLDGVVPPAVVVTRRADTPEVTNG